MTEITREELTIQIEKYLKKGGKITTCKPTLSNTDPRWNKIKESGGGNKDGSMKGIRNVSEDKLFGK